MEQNEPIIPPQKEKKEKKDKPKKKKDKPSRTVETMYRTTMGNHIRLTAIADRKAALMVSINSIIISVMTSFLVHEVMQKPTLLLPVGLLIVVCLATITFALLSTKPSMITPSKASHEKIDLLFFGDYTHLSLDDYKVAMHKMMADDVLLNDTMIENIYAQGIVIQHKFRFLNIAYRIFMYGFPLAIISLLVTMSIR